MKGANKGAVSDESNAELVARLHKQVAELEKRLAREQQKRGRDWSDDEGGSAKKSHGGRSSAPSGGGWQASGGGATMHLVCGAEGVKQHKVKMVSCTPGFSPGTEGWGLKNRLPEHTKLHAFALPCTYPPNTKLHLRFSAHVLYTEAPARAVANVNCTAY
jgi:hypothetical protein